MSAYESNAKEMAEAASLMHLTKAGWPAEKLAEWLINCTQEERFAYAGMRTTGEGQDKVIEIIEKIKKWKKGDPLIYGGNELLAFLAKQYPLHLGNYSVSLDGKGRLQLVDVARSQKTGQAPEIQPRSWKDKILNRGKDREGITSNA